MAVYDRLTDKSGYTGMYAQHDEQAVVPPSEAEQHATFHAKGFGEAPVQKFGLQVDKPVKFMCWNGLDKHAVGQPITMTNIRTIEQLVTKCCQACSVSPQPKHFHTPQGRPVTTLGEFRDGENYILIQSGAAYKKETLPIALVAKLTDRPMSPSEKKMREMDRSLFSGPGPSPASSSSASTASASPPSGAAVPALPRPSLDTGVSPTATGVSPRRKTGSTAGTAPVPGAGAGPGLGAGGGVFDRLTDETSYTGMYAQRDATAVDTTRLDVERHATGHAKAFGEAPVQKFGVQVDKPPKIIVWNGLDKHAQGKPVLVQNMRTLDQLITKCCQACNVSPQPTCLHTPQGKPVKSLEALEDGVDYVVIQSGARYRKESLPTALVQKVPV